MKNMKNKFILIGSLIISVVVSILIYIVPTITTSKTEMGSIDHVGDVFSKTSNGFGFSIIFAGAAGIISVIIMFLAIFALIMFLAINRMSLITMPILVLVLPNIVSVASLIIVPITLYESETIGDASAWFSESTSGSLNIFGWLFLILLLGLGIFNSIYFTNLKKLEIESYESQSKVVGSSSGKSVIKVAKVKENPKTKKITDQNDFRF